MSVSWRPLLDSIRQPWRDRGSNTSAGNVNICCPWCVDDRGFHLSIAESKEAYYCYRNPSRHSGTNLVRLLVGLGVSRDESQRLLNRFSSGQRLADRPAREISPQERLRAARAWSHAPLASDYFRYADYLRFRGYSNPERIALRYDLRCIPEGRWANRLLLPVKDADGQVLTWTGRAVLDSLAPKYLVEAADNPLIPLLYIPDQTPFRSSAARAIIVEGPLDALRLAAAEPARTGVIALMGKGLNATKLWRLLDLLVDCRAIDLALDNDAGLSEQMTLLNELRGLGLAAPIRRIRIPADYKDAAEMSLREASSWMEHTDEAQTDYPSTRRPS